MIRVIYKWCLKSGDEKKFRAAWEKATTAIRESTPGARGSFLLRSHEDSKVLLTVARWDKLEDWQLFWENADHSEMHEMHVHAERLSEEVFYEIEDHTT